MGSFEAGVRAGMIKTANPIVGMITAGKGRRMAGLGRGFMYSMGGSNMGQAMGTNVATGVAAGRHARGESWKGGTPEESEIKMFGLNREQVAKRKLELDAEEKARKSGETKK
jgi:hypothetical protein